MPRGQAMGGAVRARQKDIHAKEGKRKQGGLELDEGGMGKRRKEKRREGLNEIN